MGDLNGLSRFMSRVLRHEATILGLDISSGNFFFKVIMFLALLTVHKVGKELFTVSVGK